MLMNKRRRIQLLFFCANVSRFEPTLIDMASEVTRLNSVSHCIDSYLRVSRPLNYLLMSVPIYIWLKRTVLCVWVEKKNSGGGIAGLQRLEELVFYVHLFTCPSSLMGLSREGWIGLEVATLQWNCIVAALRVWATVLTSKIPPLSVLFQFLLSPIGEEKWENRVQAHIQ